VRVRLQTKVSIKEFQPDVETYTREYALVSGEPFLRMRTTGAAQEDYSVITSFPLSESDPVDRIVHGTPCHWTSVQPLPAWDPPIFRATHRFLLPQAGSTVLAAIYHQDVPAWSFTGTNDAVPGQGVLIGCLLRNTQGPCYVEGTDPDPHMLNYALRIPKGLGDPTTGQPLSEALNYTMPAVASLINPPAFDLNSDAMLLESGFLASIASPGVILAAKPGEVAPGTLVLRLYQATNSEQPQPLTVTLGAGQPSQVTAVTALEDPIKENAPVISINENGFTINVMTALNTVEVTLGPANQDMTRKP
jgi:alpha-mannosidase